MSQGTRIIAALLALGVSTAFAAPSLADGLRMTDRMELRRHCVADVVRLCGSVVPGEGRIRACIGKHFAEFSAPCRLTVEKLELLPPDNPQPDGQG